MRCFSLAAGDFIEVMWAVDDIDFGAGRCGGHGVLLLPRLVRYWAFIQVQQ